MAPPAKKERYTFANCLAWGENERIEIINGEAVMMAPPSRVHQEISGELFAQLHTCLKGKKCKVYSVPFAVRLFEQAGVREYWIVAPTNKDAQSLVLEDSRYSVKGFGTAADTMKVNIPEDCLIDLSEVFTEQ